MAQKLLKLTYIYILLAVGCIPAQLLRYNTDIAQATQIKMRAYADFQVFDAGHQLDILASFSIDEKKYTTEIDGYRARRAVVAEAIKKQAQQDADDNKSTTLLSTDMDAVSSKILRSANDLSAMVEHFISDERMHLSIAKRGI